MTRRLLRVDVTWATMMRVIGAVALVWLWLRLWRWLLLLVVAAFLAVALDPLVAWLDARRIRRAYAAPLVVLVIALLLSGFVYLAGASLVEQGRLLSGKLGELQDEITRRVPAGILELLPGRAQAGSGSGGFFTRMGRALMSGVVSVGVALILTIYLLVDGRRTFEWLVAFFPRERRPRVRETAVAARTSVTAYVRGNVSTSAIAAVVTYVVLTALQVPAALLLALLAALFDFVPVLGIFLTAVPAALLALTVSPATAIAVLAFILLYNAFENYFIAPKVYGRELRLSDLAVIAAFAVGAELGGVVGALVALPFAAMYPAIEKIWLAERLGHDVVQDHRRIEQAEDH